jgi:FtsP/CotA-like multicopper oxidase with cupredoxin domain
MTDRRTFLFGLPMLGVGTPTLGALAQARPLAPTLPEPFLAPLRLPGPSGLLAAHRLVRPLRLTAQLRRHSLFAGRATDLMTYHASIDGRDAFNPLLRIRSGEAMDVTLANQLGEDTTIHWHGMIVDEANDGSGMSPVRHGESYVYRFAVRNRAGLYWYHPHPHDRTGAQVHLGMGSLLMVEDAEEDALRAELGLELGRNEIPLLIQDKQVDDRNRIRYEMGEDDWIGNRVLVNFTPEPFFDAALGLYRFRLLNGSNARTYLIAFLHAGRRLPFSLIGTDGGLLPAAQAATEVFLAPAQRIDVLVDFSTMLAGSTVMLASERYDPMENEGSDVDPAMEHPGAPAMGAPIPLMKINLKLPERGAPRTPRALSSLAPAPAPKSAPRKFRLHARGRKWYINGYNFHDDMRAIKARVARGSVEIWELSNDAKSMPHPMHVHGFQFRVHSRRGSPAQVRALAVSRSGLTAQDLGPQDTVLVWPGETVSIVIDFSQPFTGVQRYMFHCHNLEHEDQGMMLTFAVEDGRRVPSRT